MMNGDERIYAMMMEALDGELTAAGWLELEADLRARPDLAREWRLLQSIDALLRETPALAPAADFVQRTLVRLPDSRQRVWALAVAYLLLLVGGLLPLGAIIWFVTAFGHALVQPGLWRGLAHTLSAIVNVAQTVLSGLWQVLAALGRQASEQPGVWGWLFVMLGLVMLWRGVYQQLMRPSSDWTSERA